MPSWGLTWGAALGLGAIGGAGGFVSTLASGGGISTSIRGWVSAGPLVSEHRLTIDVYDAQGQLLRSGIVVDAQGRFDVSFSSLSSGPLLLKVRNASSGADYLDEASQALQDLKGTLMAIGVPNAQGVLEININPLTALLARLVGVSSTGNVSGTLDGTVLNNKQQLLADALGLSVADLLGTVPTTTVTWNEGTRTAQANAAFDASQGLSRPSAMVPGWPPCRAWMRRRAAQAM